MRGEAFGFYLLGFFLERADMTARILDVKYHLLLPDVVAGRLAARLLPVGGAAEVAVGLRGLPPQVPRRCGPIDVAEFVILDADFPRSLRFAVDRMQQALMSIGVERAQLAARPRRRGARAPARQAATPRGSLQAGLHEFLDEFLRASSALHEALASEYFEAHLGRRALAAT